MKAFDDVLKRINEIEMPKEYVPMVTSVFEKISKTFDSMPGLKVNFEKLFSEKLFGSLKIKQINLNEDKLASRGTRGFYDIANNTIYTLSSNDESSFCHEVIHFMIRNLYPELYDEISKFGIVPMWLDEALTQRLTNLIMNTPRATAYGMLLSLVSFIERNIGEQFSLTDFLNGESFKMVDNYNLYEFKDDLNHFADNYTEQSGYEACSRVILHYYNQFINKQLKNPSIKLEDLIKSLALYEAQTLYDGTINPFTIERVDAYFLQTERDKIYNTCNTNNISLVSRLISSKKINVDISEEQILKTEIFIKNYLSYLKKEALNNNGGSYKISSEELLSLKALPKIKEMLNKLCFEALLKENEQKQQQTVDSFFDSVHQVWAGRDEEGTLKNIQTLNGFSEVLNSQLLLTQPKRSLIAGNTYFLMPLYDDVKKDKVLKPFSVSAVKDLKKVSEFLQHGYQSNIVANVNNEVVPVGNLIVAGGDVGLSVNYKGVWEYLPNQTKSEILSGLNMPKVSSKEMV